MHILGPCASIFIRPLGGGCDVLDFMPASLYFPWGALDMGLMGGSQVLDPTFLIICKICYLLVSRYTRGPGDACGSNWGIRIKTAIIYGI